MKIYKNSQERLELKVDKEFVPYLSKNYSMKDIDRYSRLKWNNKTVLNIDKLHIFTDIEFENILDDLLYRCSTKDLAIGNLDQLIDQIIIETKLQEEH